MKGFDTLVKIGDKVVAAQTNCSLDRNTEVVDISNKISLNWKKWAAGAKDWMVSCNGAFIADDEAMILLNSSFVNGTPVDVKMSDGTTTYQGQGIIESFPLNAMYDMEATYSLTIRGTGELE